MVNYQLAKVYKIVCRITGENYVGSTCEPTLARRLVAHSSACKAYYEKKEVLTWRHFKLFYEGTTILIYWKTVLVIIMMNYVKKNVNTMILLNV